MATSTFAKFPAETFAVTVDFTDSLATGDSLTTHTVTATKVSDSSDATSTVIDASEVVLGVVEIQVKDGTASEDYLIDVQVDTLLGDLFEKQVTMRILPILSGTEVGPFAYSLCPQLRFGGPAVPGGYLYTYDAGSSIPRATYADAEGFSQNTNPVVLDSAGRANIWLQGYYYFELWTGDKDEEDTQATLIWSQDNVSGEDVIRSDLSSTATGKGAALIGATGQSGKTLGSLLDQSYTLDIYPGSVTTGDLRVTGPWYDSRRETTLAAAIAAAEAAGKWLLVTEDVHIGSAISAPTLLRLECAPGVTIYVDASVGNNPALTLAANKAQVIGCTFDSTANHTDGNDDDFMAPDTLDVNLRRTLVLTGDDVLVKDSVFLQSVVGVEFSTVNRGKIVDCFAYNDLIVAGSGPDVTAYNNYHAAFYFDASHDCVVENVTTYGHGQGLLSGAVGMRNTVINSRFFYPSNNGTYFSSGHGHAVIGSTTYGADNDGFKARGTGTRFIGNRVYQPDTTTVAQGILSVAYVVEGTGTPTGDYNGFEGLIEGNYAEGNFENAYRVDAQDGGFLKNFIITNNQWKLSGDRSLHAIVVSPAGADGFEITNNRGEGHNIGVYLNPATGKYYDRGLISGNGLDSPTGDGIRATRLRYSRILGNSAQNATSSDAGINLIESSYNLIANNDVSDPASAGVAYGIEETGASDYNRYLQNILPTYAAGVTLPAIFAGVHNSVVPAQTAVVETLAGHRIFFPGEARTYILDPGGSGRNVTPNSQQFPEGYEVTVINTADAAETLTFDPSGIAAGVPQGVQSQFVYTGTAWVRIGDLVVAGATTASDGDTITHGFGSTPSVVTITGSVAGEFVAVTAVSSTTFTVAIRATAGAGGDPGTTQTIYWRVS